MAGNAGMVAGRRDAPSRHETTAERLGAFGSGALSLLAYVAVFAVLAWPWLEGAVDSVPRSVGTPFVYADDARFIILVLGWVAHALARAPLSLFDLPIEHPAPRQLSGSEHFLTSQILAAPVFWATGNAVLATNVATLASYPL